MNKTQRGLLSGFGALLMVAAMAGLASADISQKQVRNSISRMAGMSLPNKTVRVLKINQVSADTVEATAELELAFRLVQNQNGDWQVKEVRTGPESWENVSLIASALKTTLTSGDCSESQGNRKSTVLTVGRARCLVANVFSIKLPSDSVRISEISTLSIPIGTEPSGLTVTLVQGDFRLHKAKQGWEVTDFKIGNHDWISIEGIADSMNQAKLQLARAELQTLAHALSEYKKARGSYVVSDKHGILVDHLSPTYLQRVIRLDPWHHPYRYQGDADRFTLRSSGPDGKPDSADDIVVAGSGQ